MLKILFRTAVAAAMVPGLALLAGCPGPSTPIPGISIGNILQGLTGNVDNIINTATDGAQTDILTAAGSVQAAIGTASSAYAQDLNLTLKQVNDTIASSIAQLQNMVKALYSTVTATLQTATNDAQQLINSIPFTNKNPQVTSYTPRFVDESSLRQVEITVNGNFVYAAQRHLVPTLLVGRTTIRPNENTTPQLGFAVPVSLLPSPGAGLKTVSLRLSAPYESGLVFHSRQLDSFALLLVVLPASPVKSLILDTSQAGQPIQEPRDWPPGSSSAGAAPAYVESYSTCSIQTIDPNPTIIPANHGYTVVSGSVAVTPLKNDNPGNAQVNAFATQDGSAVWIYGKTEPSCQCFAVCFSSGSGAITFYVTWTEMGIGPTTVKAQSIPIGWGNSISAQVSPGWTLKATLFDGHLIDFNNSDSTNPFIHVTNEGQNIIISTQFTDLTYGGL